jgi:23S rRNA (uridine2552-2'-O)-methyltransferase
LKKNKTSKSWINKKHRDPFFKQSRIQGFNSRSAFKLIEMNKKFNFIKKNSLLLDMGSSPGGWTQVATQKISKGKVLSVDLQLMEKISNSHFIKGDIFDPEVYKKITQYFGKKIDIVISDMAANTTGNKNLVSFKTGELCLNAMDIALKILHKDGVFISKFFMGSIFNEIMNKASMCFKKVVKYKPLSSRKESKEIYIFCKSIS